MNAQIQINIKDIKPDFKICNSQKSVSCIITGPSNSTWVGKLCRQCYAIKRASYYQKNKVVINDRITEKRRTQRAYIENDANEKPL